MIELCKGDLLEAKVEALVNAVNTQGIMGKGIALQFKKTFPEMFKAYQKAYKNGEIQIGRMHIYETMSLTSPRFIINFPTKKHWSESSSLDYIKSGLKSLIEEILTRKIKSIALPPLGCGLGGLKWENVFPLLKEAFANMSEVKVLLYPPQLTQEKKIEKAD